MLVTDAEQLWTTGAAALRTQVSDATWKAWFEGITPVESSDGRLVLAVPNALVKERIEGRYLGLVRDVVADLSASDIDIDIVVRTQERSSDAEGEGGRESRVLSGTTEVLSKGGLTRRGKSVRPKTVGQRRYVEAIRDNTIVFSIGPAGTG